MVTSEFTGCYSVLVAALSAVHLNISHGGESRGWGHPRCPIHVWLGWLVAILVSHVHSWSFLDHGCIFKVLCYGYGSISLGFPQCQVPTILTGWMPSSSPEYGTADWHPHSWTPIYAWPPSPRVLKKTRSPTSCKLSWVLLLLKHIGTKHAPIHNFLVVLFPLHQECSFGSLSPRVFLLSLRTSLQNCKTR